MTDLSEAAIAQSGDEDLVILIWQALIDVDPRSPEHETFWLSELLNYEILNGGLVQYFHNTEGEQVAETLEALARIGATNHHTVFDEAVARWRAERSMLEPMWKTVEGFSRSYEVSRLCELDEHWDEASIVALEAAFIRANVRAFVA